MISIIVAQAKNRVIGNANDLPWYLPADLVRFKQLTTGHAVIMGRNTLESIVARLGQPLPNRRNIVLTRDQIYKSDGIEIVHSVDEAIELAGSEREAFVLGGAQVFEAFLPHVDKIYLTQVDADINGDTFFPELKLDEWQELGCEHHDGDDKNEYPFDFIDLKRK